MADRRGSSTSADWCVVHFFCLLLFLFAHLFFCLLIYLSLLVQVHEQIEVVDFGDTGGQVALQRGVAFIEAQLARGDRMLAQRRLRRQCAAAAKEPAPSPAPAQAARLLESRVYVHCKAGKGRSVMMVMA